MQQSNKKHQHTTDVTKPSLFDRPLLFLFNMAFAKQPVYSSPSFLVQPIFFSRLSLWSFLTCNILQQIDSSLYHATAEKEADFISRLSVIWRFCHFQAVGNRLAGDFAISEPSEIVSLEILPFPSCQKPSRWRFCHFRTVGNRLAGDFTISEPSETIPTGVD